MVMKGNYGLNPGGRRLRRLLVGLQLVVAFVMVIFVGIVYCQRSYIYHSDYGYDKDNVLTADLTALPQEQYAALRNELEKVNGGGERILLLRDSRCQRHAHEVGTA